MGQCRETGPIALRAAGGEACMIRALLAGSSRFTPTVQGFARIASRARVETLIERYLRMKSPLSFGLIVAVSGALAACSGDDEGRVRNGNGGTGAVTGS